MLPAGVSGRRVDVVPVELEHDGALGAEPGSAGRRRRRAGSCPGPHGRRTRRGRRRRSAARRPPAGTAHPGACPRWCSAGSPASARACPSGRLMCRSAVRYPFSTAPRRYRTDPADPAAQSSSALAKRASSSLSTWSHSEIWPVSGTLAVAQSPRSSSSMRSASARETRANLSSLMWPSRQRWQARLPSSWQGQSATMRRAPSSTSRNSAWSARRCR